MLKSVIMSMVKKGTAPAIPTGLSITQIDASTTQGTFRIEWTDESDNEANFEYHYRINGGLYTPGPLVSANTELHDFVLTVNNDDDVDVILRSVNEFGESSWTALVSVTAKLRPAAPTSVSLSDLFASTAVRLTWNDNSSFETGYEIQDDASGSWFPVVTTPPNDTSQDWNPTALDGQPIKARLRTLNGSWTSAWVESNTISYTPGGGCLVSGQKIQISPKQYRLIDDLLVGDMVYTRHQHTLKWGYFEVTKHELIDVRLFVKTTFSDGSEVFHSDTHKFMTPYGDITYINLKEGDKVISGVTLVEIESFEEIKSKCKVHRIEVADAHTYVSENGILHHNMK